jgi:TatD DNase family protein
MGLADVHAHLTLPQNAAVIDELISNARNAGVTTIISNAIDAADNRAVLELSERFTLVKPAFGIHPVDAVRVERTRTTPDATESISPLSVDEAIRWIRDHIERTLAIGEIGLDGHWVPEELWKEQERIFSLFIGLALEADKPIIVHSRKREKRTFEILCEQRIGRIVWHCFGGKLKFAKQIAEHGHFFSIPANAKRSKGFTSMLVTLPRDQILFETDCPFLSPDRERQSQPADVAMTRAHTAELWGVSEEAVEKQMSDNFERLFGVEP